MFKYYDALINRSGDALPGYFVRLFDDTGNPVAIYADESETPIITESGKENAAKSDEDGMVRFFVRSGTYDLRKYDPNDVYIAPTETAIPMVGDLAEQVGEAEAARQAAEAAQAGSEAAKIGSEAARDASIAAKGDAEQAVIDASAAKSGAETAQTGAETARDEAIAASMAQDIYPVAARDDVPRGATGTGAITGGSTGTDGTFALAFTGGNFDVNPMGTFTVSGGAVTAISITGPGLYIGDTPTAPTLDFSASTGLTSAAATLTVDFLVPAGGFYYAPSTDEDFVSQFQNVAGTATLIEEHFDPLSVGAAKTYAEQAAASVQPTYLPVFPDDPLYNIAERLVVDDTGGLVIDTDPSLPTYPVFPDDPLYASDLIVDATGRVLVGSTVAVPDSYDDWQAAALGDGNVWALSPTRSVMLASPTGTAYGGQVRDGRAMWVDGASYRSMRLDALDELPGSVDSLVFIPIIGQSLTVGTSNVASLLSTTPQERAYSFNGGALPIQYAAKTTPPDGLAPIVDSQIENVIPLVERVDGPLAYYGETPLSGMVYSLTAARPASEAFLLGTFGVGSTTVAQLGAASEPFKNMIRAVERAKAMADMRGLAFDCPAFGWLQGEGDIAANTASATYEAALLAIQAAFKAAVDTICGVAADRPAVLLQPASAAFYNKANTLPAAMLDMAIANPAQIKVAGALYHLPHYDSAGVHMNALGYRKLGEEWGRAIVDVMEGGDGAALYATGASNVGTTLTIVTNAATQLVLDAATVTDPGQYGIRLRKVSDQSLVALSAIAVSGTGDIVATAAGALTPGDSYQVEIGQNLAALSAGILSGPTTGYRACFRDSSADAHSALAGGGAMRRWLAFQTITFVAA